jgi:hypothetical protein
MEKKTAPCPLTAGPLNYYKIYNRGKKKLPNALWATAAMS